MTEGLQEVDGEYPVLLALEVAGCWREGCMVDNCASLLNDGR